MAMAWVVYSSLHTHVGWLSTAIAGIYTKASETIVDISLWRVSSERRICIIALRTRITCLDMFVRVNKDAMHLGDNRGISA